MLRYSLQDLVVSVVCLCSRISEDPGNMKGQVGYCPQVDALDKFLTGRQLLYFYSLVKGIQNSEQVSARVACAPYLVDTRQVIWVQILF